MKKIKVLSEEEFMELKRKEEKEKELKKLDEIIEEKQEETKKEEEIKPEEEYQDFINDTIKEEEPKIDKVTKQEDGTKEAKKGNRLVRAIGITALCATILLVAGYGSYYTFYTIKRRNHKNKVNTEEENKSHTVISKNGISKNNVSENETNVDEVISFEEEVVDVNSEEYIKEIAEKAWNEILDERKENTNYAPSMDEEYVEDLVKYVHHDEPEYKGTYNITNDNAYGNFFELAESDKVVGTLFEGLDSEEYMKDLNNKIVNTKDNGDYKEEYAAFASIENAIDKVDLENVPESYAMMAMLDRYLGIGQDMEAMILDNKYEILDQEVTEEYEKPRDFDKWKLLYENLKKTSPNYLFTSTWDLADKEDANMEEYNKKALENMSKEDQEKQETIYNEKATDYETVAQGFYNQIESNRKTYGSFAEEFTSVDDVKEFIIFVNQFKNPNMKSKINSLETYEAMLQSYYNSCAVNNVEPILSELFEGYSFAQGKLAEAESIAATLKDGKGTDYTIPNKYYDWMGRNFYMSGIIDMSMKENAPLAIACRNQYSAYRQVGNMLNARKNQKTYDLGLGVDGQLVCPDSIDDYMINQTIPEGGHVINLENTTDTFDTAYEYIKNECKGLSK